MRRRSDRSSRVRRAATAIVALGLAVAVTVVDPAAAAEAPVGLGTASGYAVLAGSTVTNTGPTVIDGDLGLSPGTAVTGFPPGQVTGTIHAGDEAASNAKADLVTAYNDAAGRATTASVVADLGGQTLVPGVYAGGALAINGALTLDAGGDPDAVWVFKAASTFITGSSSTVVLIGGANACNVFWQVGSSATLGTNSDLVGTVLAMASITTNTGASISGRLLARNGAVTLDTNEVDVSACAAVVPGTTTTSTTSTTSTTAAPTTTTTGGSSTPTVVGGGPVDGTGSAAPTVATPGNGATTTTTSDSGLVVTTTEGGGSTTDLPRTGPVLTTTALAALVALVLGIGLVLAGRAMRRR